jgi:glycosyltransferase involved in cell wall biosynthesis
VKPIGGRGMSVLRIADVPRSTTAGMSGYMLSSGDEMENRGHRVEYWFRDRLAPRLTHPGARRLLVPWLIAAKVIRRAHSGRRPDVVEIHEPLSAPYAFLARLAGARLPACAVLSYGLNDRFWQAERAHLAVTGRRPPLRSRILVPLTLLSQARAGIALAEAVLVPSSVDRDHLVMALGIPAERVSLSYTGVARDLFDLPRASLPHARFLFLGSWLERKGATELVAAWGRLVAARPDVTLTLAGVGDGAGARAATRGLANVEVIEAVDRAELPGLLAAHDVFVLPSWFEGMPLSMLEAAAAGLACVVCDVCGNLDVFRPVDPQRDGGILIATSSADALYAAMLALADDGGLRRALGARARERARHFGWGRSAEQALSAYAAALGRSRNGGGGR